MLHVTNFDANGFYYAVGNSPAFNLAGYLPPENDADILLLGCGDVRNILFTIFTEAESELPASGLHKHRKFNFTCCDIEGGVIGRNILVLSMILKKQNESLIWQMYYDMLVSDECVVLMKDTIQELLALSQDIKSWNKSEIGGILRLGSRQTLTIVRRYWARWLQVLESRGKEKQVTNSFRSGWKAVRKANSEGKAISTGARSAGPLVGQAVLPVADHFDHYWESGTTSKGANEQTRLNPTFAFSKYGADFDVHYGGWPTSRLYVKGSQDLQAHDTGTDPLQGFHLATAFIPFTGTKSSSLPSDIFRKESKQDFSPFVDCAKKEFEMWILSFQKTHKAGLLVIHFVVDDALELCASLSSQPRTKAASEKIADQLAEADFISKGYQRIFPENFNAIDVSNLVDHLGIYNVLLSVLPLLRLEYTTCLYTETLLLNEFDPSHGEEALCKVLGVDSASLFTILGIAPIDYVSGHTPISSTAEIFLEALGGPGKGNMSRHCRLVWKHLLSQEPAGAQDIKLVYPGDISLTYDVRSMVMLLSEIYKKLFEVEDHMRNFQRMTIDLKERGILWNLQHNTRATFSLLLSRVKDRTSSNVDWDSLMNYLEFEITNNSGSMIASCYLQEQYSLNHIYGVHTKDYFSKDPVLAAREYGGFHTISDPSATQPLTCITIAAPITAFQPLLKLEMERIGTPPLNLQLSSGMLLNQFGSLRRRHGKLSLIEATVSSHAVIQSGSPLYTEDPEGWKGKSTILYSCMVPTWMILLPDCQVSIAVTSTPQTTFLIPQLGFQLRLFQSDVANSQNVRLSTQFPKPDASDLDSADSQGSKIAILQTPHEVASEIVEQKHAPENKFQHGPNPDNTPIKLNIVTRPKPRIEGFVYHLDGQPDKELSKLLEIKAPITTTRIGSSAFMIQVGSKKIRAVYPYPVGNSTKLSIARKSLYIELAAPLFRGSVMPAYQRFPIGSTKENKISVSSWNFHRINLENSPPVSINYHQSQRMNYEWINTAVSLSFSDSERKNREMSNLEQRLFVGDVLTEIKESIHTIIIRHIGIQGGQCSAFVLQNPQRKKNYMLLLVANIRLDLSGQSIIADCGMVPLEENIMRAVTPHLAKMESMQKLAIINTQDEEEKAWIQLSACLVERCRAWSHNVNKCEYLKVGEIPLLVPDGKERHSPICSCGKNIFPKTFTDNPLFKPLLPYATRVALCPLYPPPYSTKTQSLRGVMDMFEKEVERDQKPGSCAVCSKTEATGASIMKCSRCKKREYCGKDCQKKDWKQHKAFCLENK